MKKDYSESKTSPSEEPEGMFSDMWGPIKRPKYESPVLRREEAPKELPNFGLEEILRYLRSIEPKRGW